MGEMSAIPDEARLIEIEHRARRLFDWMDAEGWGSLGDRFQEDFRLLVAVIREHLKPALPSAPIKSLRRSPSARKAARARCAK
jgi:hypothetical protein